MKRKGAYILILRLGGDEEIQIGKLRKIHFKKGYYAYIGSALGTGGFKRVERHFNIAKGINPTRRWHIDYLLHYITIVCAILIPTETNIECDLALKLKNIKDIREISGFGCTDCYCNTHLYYAENNLENEIIVVCKKFGKDIDVKYE